MGILFGKDLSAPMAWEKVDGTVLGNYTPCIQKIRSEKNNMSILITVKNRNGICMASDSRLTTVLNGTNLFRDDAKKVFKTDMFLLGVTGCADVIHGNSHELIQETVERIISRDAYLSADQFQAALYGELKGKPGTAYHFVFGYREKDSLSGSDYVLRYVELMDGYFVRNEKIYHDSILAVGENSLVPPAVSVNPDWDLQKLEDVSRRMVENAIGMGELFLQPDTVGGNIQSEWLA